MKILPTLHILNGDASVPAFKVANLPGQILVWREILASGPAVGTIPEASFWQMRERYITETFQAAESDYRSKVLADLSKLENVSNFFEVVLWFDTDLVCQINLLFLLQKFAKNKPALLSVCTPESRNIGYSTHEEMQVLFEHRRTLEATELQQASVLWDLYAGPDPAALQRYLQENQVYAAHLKQALELHLQRFPAEKTGLGEHQKLLLKSLSADDTPFSEVQKKFWDQDPGYGFGDMQLQSLLEEMAPELVHIRHNAASITTTGKQVLQGETEFKKELTYWLGGVQVELQKPTWYRNEKTGQVLFSKDRPDPE